MLAFNRRNANQRYPYSGKCCKTFQTFSLALVRLSIIIFRDKVTVNRDVCPQLEDLRVSGCKIRWRASATHAVMSGWKNDKTRFFIS